MIKPFQAKFHKTDTFLKYSKSNTPVMIEIKILKTL